MKVLISICVFLLISCGNDEFESKKISKNKDKIVVLIESDDINNPIYVGRLRTFENYNRYKYITNKAIDTLRIHISGWDMITIGSRKTFLDTLIVNKNDTIELRLKEGKFINHIRGRKKIKKWRYSSILGDSKIKKEVDSIFDLFFILTEFNEKTPPLIVKNEFYKLKLPMSRIRPNKTSRKLSDTLFPILIEKYKKLIIQYEDFINLQESDKSKADFLNKQLEKEVFKKVISLFIAFEDDKLLNFLNSNYFLNKKNYGSNNEFVFLNRLFISQLNKLKMKRNPTLSDLYDGYNLIPKFFENDYSEKVKMVCLEQIAQRKFSLDSLTKYINRFNSEYNNNPFGQYIKTKYLLDEKILNNISHEVNFVNSIGEKSDLETLLKNSQGKVVYIDFWASWCAPCRKVMPSSRKLKENYKNKNVEFVFFSIDNDKDMWLSASKTEMINEHNYLILNHHASNLKNQLKINKIPRYLLYNQDGVLINHDAPGPETNEIRILIDKLLSIKRKPKSQTL